MNFGMKGDRLLAGLVRMGSQRALSEVMERYSDMIWRLCLRLLGDSALADDITQEVFVRFWSKAGDYRPEFSLSTWLYRIAYNMCIDELRSLSARKCPDMPSEAPRSCSPDYGLIRRDDALLVRKALAGLSPLQRTVFILREAEGLGYDEISRITGAGYDSLKSNLYIAKKKIRQWITEQ